MARKGFLGFPFGVSTVGVFLAIVILVATWDAKFALTASICLAVSAGFLYGLKWYRKTYFATRRRQERRNRAVALKG